MVREEVVETAARDKARYLEDLACIAADEAAAQRACWNSSLAEAVRTPAAGRCCLLPGAEPPPKGAARGWPSPYALRR
jgi:hypothetical protein